MLEVCAFAIAASVVYLIVKEHKSEYVIIVEIAAALIIFIFLLPELKSVLDFSQEIFDLSGLDKDFFILLLKALGIAIISQFSSDMLKDSGQNAIAAKVELAARAVILVMCLPMLRAVLQMTIGLIK